MSMEGPIEVGEDLGASLQDPTANEVVYLIRKLRWMGLEEEAKSMETELALFRVLPGDSVIGGPADTD
jgi:hypothetical protein